MKSEQPAAAGAATGSPIVLSTNCVIEGKFFAAGEPIPFANEAAVLDPLKPFVISEDADADAPPGPPGIRFEPGRVYDVDDRGAIITRAGARDAARLAGEASWQVEAARPLDPETAAILQEKHDVDVALQIKTAEIRARDADAVIAAQDEGAGAEQKPAATFFVKRGAVFMHAGKAKLRPGEQVFVKEPSGAWAVAGTTDINGGLPPPQEVI